MDRLISHLAQLVPFVLVAPVGPLRNRCGLWRRWRLPAGRRRSPLVQMRRALAFLPGDDEFELRPRFPDVRPRVCDGVLEPLFRKVQRLIRVPWSLVIALVPTAPSRATLMTPATHGWCKVSFILRPLGDCRDVSSSWVALNTAALERCRRHSRMPYSITSTDRYVAMLAAAKTRGDSGFRVGAIQNHVDFSAASDARTARVLPMTSWRRMESRFDEYVQ